MENQDNRRYTALEITSKAVRLVHGFVQKDLVHVLYVAESSVDALQNGKVVESDALLAAIKSVVNSCNDTLKIKIRDVVLVLPPMGLSFGKKATTTNTISIDNKVMQIDIDNAISLLKKVKTADGIQIVDVIPYKYIIDNQDISEIPPIGKTSSSITVHATLYALENSVVSSFVNVVEHASIKVKRCVIAPFADSLYFENIDYIPKNYFILNIGAKITTITLISNGSIVVQNGCYSKGGDNLTQALADKFNLSFKEAKMLKEKFGIQNQPSFKCYVYKNITVKDISDTLLEAISPLVINLKKKINEWTNNGQFKTSIYLTGGGTKLYGLSSLLENEFGMDCVDVTPYSFGARDKSYQNLLGAIKYSDKYIPKREEESLIKTNNVSRVGHENSKQKEKAQTSSYRIQDEL